MAKARTGVRGPHGAAILTPPIGTRFDVLSRTLGAGGHSRQVNVSLLRALRIVINADSDPVRQVLFANLVQARRSVRWAYRVHAQLAGTWASALLISGFGLAYFLRISFPSKSGASILTAAKHANARRQIARVCGWVGQEHCGQIRTTLEFSGALAGLTSLVDRDSPAILLRSLRIIRGLDRKYGFLVACRSVAAIAWYARTKAILVECRPGAVLVSSDSNPEEVGFTAAASELAIPRVFVSHAYPTPFSPALNFSLSILEGEGAVRSRTRRSPIKGEIVLAGVEGDSAPLDVARFERKGPVIGIFAPKAVSWPTLAAVIEDCRHAFDARQIVIRWHPSRLDQARHLHSLGDLSGIEESPMTAALSDVARRCDWVIADENSNVHLPVLKLGIPTIVVKGLGLYPASRSDMYGFAAAGIVFPPVASIREVRAPALKAFFEDGWAARFRQYDASYMRSQAEIGAEVRRAIWRLIEAPREKMLA
jgi:hypothetical protein